MRKFRRILTNLSLVLGSVLICLLLAEAGLRLFPPAHVDTTTRGMWREHPTRGFAMLPNVSVRRWKGIDWTNNSQGFRDRDHDLRADGFRIVAIGDSYLAGHEVEYEDMFLHRLELALKVDVVKLAVGGYNTVQERLLWQEEGRAYKPDLVLLGIYLGNDLNGNAIWPRKRCVHEGWLVACTGVETTQAQLLARFLAMHSVLARQALIVARGLLRRGKTRSEPAKKKQDPPGLRYGNIIENLYRKQWPERTRRGYRVLLENVLLLKKDVEQSGANLVVVVIPAESQIYPEQWADHVRRNGLNPADFEPRRSVILLTQWLESQSIHQVNLLPSLIEASKTDDNLHPGHWHWSVPANQLVAEVVGRYLIEQKLVPAPE